MSLSFLPQCALWLLLLVTNTPSVSSQDVYCSFRNELDLKNDGSLILRHSLNPVASTLTLELEYQGEAWLGLAVSETMVMVPNVAAIGLPDENNLVERRSLALSVDQIEATDTQTYTDATITQANGVTTLTYTRPLVDDGEVSVVEGEPTTILWAHGDGTNDFGYHGLPNKGAVIVMTLDACLLEDGDDAAVPDDTPDDGDGADDTLDETPDDTPSDGDGDGAADTPDDTANGTPDDTPSDGDGTADTPDDTANGTPDDTPDDGDGTDDTPDETPDDTPSDGDGDGAVDTPDDTANGTPDDTPDDGDGTDDTPDETPDDTPSDGDGDGAVDTPDDTANGTPDDTPSDGDGADDTPDDTANETPDDTPDDGDGADNNTPDDTADDTPRDTPDDTSTNGLNCSFRGELDLREDGTILLRQILNPDESTVTFELEYQGEAWLGLAVSETEFMVPNVAAIGLPDENNLVERRSLAFSVGQVEATDTQTYTDATITQANGVTTLTYTRPLVDDGEVSVVEGEPTTILWAHGDGTNDFGYHGAPNRGATSVTLDACLAAGATASPVPPTTEAPVAAQSTSAPAVAPGGSTELSPGVRQQRVVLQEGLEATFTTDENAETVTVDMVYEGLGYIALAWSDDLFMPGSVAAMALPDDGLGEPRKWDLGSRSQAGVTLAPEDRQTFTDASYFQNDTHTGMTFTKPLVDGDEPIVSINNDNNFLWAVGRDNTFAVHSERLGFSLNFLSEDGVQAAAGPRRKLWVTHGILMATSWGILVPLAVASSLLKKVIPFPPGTWFQIHRGLNSLGVAMTIAGFGIAVHLLNDEQGDSVKHFSAIRHHTIGLVVFIFAFLQALSGIFRPHVPAPKPPQEADVEDAAADPAPVEKKSNARIAFEFQHKILGTVTMILAWYNCSSGIEEYDRRFGNANLQGAFWGVVAGITFLTFGLVIFSRCKQDYN